MLVLSVLQVGIEGKKHLAQTGVTLKGGHMIGGDGPLTAAFLRGL